MAVERVGYLVLVIDESETVQGVRQNFIIGSPCLDCGAAPNEGCRGRSYGAYHEARVGTGRLQQAKWASLLMREEEDDDG